MYRKTLFAIFMLSGLVGCVTGYAPVTDLSESRGTSRSSYNKAPSQRVISQLPSTYRVKSGDTLYSIAWKYGLDFKQLAKKNNISSRYLIYKGQLLTIKGTTAIAQNSKPKLNGSASALVKSNKKTSFTTSTNLSNNQQNNSSNTANNKNSTAKKPTQKASQTRSSVVWKWPVKSRKYNRFTNENKGIDFPGVKGQDVFSAASGKVVYAGNGIIGYGNLIIIKHSQKYLSAYAHNSVILVEEGELIKVGGKIAEIGNSGTIKTILHFEIRKDGKPVDPLQYLPKN